MKAETKYGIGDKIYFLKFEEKDKKPIMGNVTICEGIIEKIFIEHIERPDYTNENFLNDNPQMIPYTEVGYIIQNFGKIFIEEQYVSDSINGLIEMLFKRSNRNQRYQLVNGNKN